MSLKDVHLKQFGGSQFANDIAASMMKIKHFGTQEQWCSQKYLSLWIFRRKSQGFNLSNKSKNKANQMISKGIGNNRTTFCAAWKFSAGVPRFSLALIIAIKAKINNNRFVCFVDVLQINLRIKYWPTS